MIFSAEETRTLRHLANVETMKSDLKKSSWRNRFMCFNIIRGQNARPHPVTPIPHPPDTKITCRHCDSADSH